MPIRVIVGFLFVTAFSIYAYRNYFVSLCALLVFTAFFKHPDMPRGVMGIPGLEFWNVLLANVTLAWLMHRRHEGLVWDLPRGVKVALWLYLSVVGISFLRMLIDPTQYYRGTTTNIILDYLISPMKFLLPALILFDSARTPERMKLAMAAIMLGYFFLSLQVVRYMGLHVYSGEELNKRGAKILQNAVGYDRVDVAMMLAGSVWAMVAFARVIEQKWKKLAVLGAAGFILFAETLTGGRGGYAACGVIGLIMCVVRWRKILPVLPVLAVIVLVVLPGMRERILHGFDKQSGNIVVEQNHSEITSGRSIIWPYVIKKIEAAPIIGYGRDAMARTGLADWIYTVLGEEFGHPHNAYLEILLDDGIIGFLCIVPLYLICMKKSLGLFHDRTDVLYEAAGGIAFALLLALFLTAFGAQTLYPREDVIWMWGAIGIALRVWMQREEAQELEAEAEEEPEYADGMFSHQAAKSV